MKGCTHGSTAGFHLQTRDTNGGMVPLLKEQERHSERRERGEGQRNIDWCAGSERERERDLKQRIRRMKGEGSLVVYPVTG